MRFHVDHRERSPIYRQLADQVRYAISVGALKPGDVLPSIRQLESELGVNRNTIRRAYLDLEAEGLLVIRQGREASVATGAASRPRDDASALADIGADLAALLIQRAESEGVDAVHLTEHLAVIAREHDAAHPRFAFLECSRRQATYFARRAEEHFGRRVVGLDLHDLHEDEDARPPSLRYALTPPWHIAEARSLFGRSHIEVFPISVAICSRCAQRLQSLPPGIVGLVVRDAESGPGFRAVLKEVIGPREIDVLVLNQVDPAGQALGHLASVVMTSPCVDAVEAAAPTGLRQEELIFEPSAEELAALRARLFPAFSRKVMAGL